MKKHQLTPKERKARFDARDKIMSAANKAIIQGRRTEPLNKRQLQLAVFMCRQRGLVKPDVLVTAGFNPS